MASKYDLYVEANEEKKEYYIKDRNGLMTPIYQYGNYIPYRRATMKESGEAHLTEILKADAEAEKERVTVEKLQQELNITKMAIDELMMLSVGGGM